MYPYEERAEAEDGKFWFFDGMHNAEPLYPFDTIMTEWPNAHHRPPSS